MKRAARWILAAAMTAVLAGCQAHFTRQTYETIYVGMPSDLVRQNLGKPSATTDSAWTYEHAKPPYYRAVIAMKDGKVTQKTWSVDKPAPATLPAK